MYYVKHIRLRQLMRLNVLKTLIINLRLLPFSKAIKFPILLLGRVDISDSRYGKLEINCPVRRGLMKVGFYPSRVFGNNTPEVSRLAINGTLVLNGNLSVGNGSVFEIEIGGIAQIGNDVHFQSKTRLYVEDKLIIGDTVRFAWDTQLFDTDFHYALNVEKNTVRRKTKPIDIGSNVWVGNRCSIMKGAVLPDNCIVASNSVVNKDLSTEGQYSTFAGIPAKKVGGGYVRVFPIKDELRLDSIFELTKEKEVSF